MQTREVWRFIRQHLPASHYVAVALFFFAGLEATFAIQRAVPISLLTLFGLMTVGVVVVRKEESEDFHFTQTFLPILAAVGLTAFALFLPAGPLLHLYFLVASIVFYFLLQFAARKAYPTWNWGISAVVLFVDLAAVLGWHFHMARSLILTLFLTWLITLVLAWQALHRVPRARGEAFLLALCIGFVVTEVVWVLQFTPLHFFIQTGVGLTMYYVLFQGLTRSFERPLAARDMVEYTLIAAVAFIILLLDAQWI